MKWIALLIIVLIGKIVAFIFRVLKIASFILLWAAGFFLESELIVFCMDKMCTVHPHSHAAHLISSYVVLVISSIFVGALCMDIKNNKRRKINE